MKKNLGSISGRGIVCAVLSLVLLLGLFMPIVSFGGVEKVLQTMADGAPRYELEELLDAIADTLKKGSYTKDILNAFADYDWDYASPKRKNVTDLDDYYEDILDRVETRMERGMHNLESLLSDYEDDLEDIFDYEDYSDLPSVARKVLNEPEVLEFLGLYIVYYMVELYCSLDEDSWEVVDMNEFITTMQQYARAMADGKFSAVEIGRLLRTLVMSADLAAAEMDEEDLEELIEDIKDGYYDGDAEEMYLPLLKLLNNRWVLRAANIAWSVMEVLYAIAVIAIAALALSGKKKRGSGLSVVVTVVGAIVLIGSGVFCTAINHGVGDVIEASGVFYLSKTLRLCAIGFGAILVPILGAALAVLTKRMYENPAPAPRRGGEEYSPRGWRDVVIPGQPGDRKRLPAGGWKCVCGNACSDAQRFCTSCGRSRPEPKAASRCHVCGEELEEGSVFCPSCGTRQNDGGASATPRCSNCGYELDEGTLFCPSCGQRQ